MDLEYLKKCSDLNKTVFYDDEIWHVVHEVVDEQDVIYLKRYVYDFKPKINNKWIRLRTNGEKTTLTIKDLTAKTIDGTKELEIEVTDFEKMNLILKDLGYIPKGYQENRRIQYILNGLEIDIDSWPKIPTYMEIEGESEEEVLKMVEFLEIDKSKLTALGCSDIYKEIYGIELEKIKELKF